MVSAAGEPDLLKLELRRVYKGLRQEVDPDLKRLYDAEIASHVRALSQYASCAGLLLYASMPGEVDTSDMIACALTEGKRIALPKVCGGGVMRFYEVSSVSGLVLSRFGVPEPDHELCAEADPADFALCVVPGLCFDADGYRIGYGGGYYDRFLARYGGFAVGVCYSMFIEPNLPRESFDMRVNHVITENGVLRGTM